MFNIKTAQQHEIVKPTVVKVEEKIFDKYVRLTLEKVNTSFLEAQGRYEEGEGYKDPKPSMNWKVLKKAENCRNLEEVNQEEVSVWLKIGIKKVEIAPGKREIKIPASALVDTLKEMKALVESFQQNPKSDEAKAFHDIAIQQAKPKTAPKQKYHPDTTAWEYQKDSDSYVAV